MNKISFKSLKKASFLNYFNIPLDVKNDGDIVMFVVEETPVYEETIQDWINVCRYSGRPVYVELGEYIKCERHCRDMITQAKEVKVID